MHDRATEHINSLGRASSSYLRSAMHQPIEWNEWGEEAFARAQRENKPVLLDIGAVWCHWCHVMDRESYDNPEIAKIINENFVAIKVDRDERPDVDARYQAAVQAISGQGGWPLTAFLTPEGHPFFGGTYFPPDENWGRPSFRRVLLSLARAYQEKHDEVLESAGSVMGAIAHQEAFTGFHRDVDPKVIENIVAAALKQFDPQYGGFGDKPKFPHSSALDLCLDMYSRTRSEQLHELIFTTLRGMAHGGIYDQLAGGFHRYSVDEKWIVPHFEKMLYDNSELLKNYVHAAQVLNEPFFAKVARDIIRWTDEWLSDRERGGFYASQDADHSMEDDGDYFTWTAAEARAVLSPEEFSLAAEHFDIGEVGEMHHDPTKNVLWIKSSVEELAQKRGVPPDSIRQLLDSAKRKLYAARLARPTPYVDKTIYVNWNAMMVSAYLQAAAVLELPQVRAFALKSLDRLIAEGWQPQQAKLAHVIAYSDPKSSPRALAGMLDDYAFMVIACLDAYEANADLTYYRFAHAIAEAMLKRFADDEGGAFFDMDASSHPALLGALTAKRKPLQDAPTPAANPAAAIALLRLYSLSNDERHRAKAENTLRTFAGVADQFGLFAATYGIALRLLVSGQLQVVIVGNDASQLERAAQSRFALNKSVLHLRSGEAVSQNLPPGLAATAPHLSGGESSPIALVCSGSVCQPPTRDPEELSASIRDMVK